MTRQRKWTKPDEERSLREREGPRTEITSGTHVLVFNTRWVRFQFEKKREVLRQGVGGTRNGGDKE